MRPENPPSVDDVRELAAGGPWSSKSGGFLSVPFAMPHAEAMKFLRPDPAELARLSSNISGLRMFFVEDVPKGGVGGEQFHRIRTEILFTISGKMRWACEDLYGAKREFLPERGVALVIPPFILHTNVAEEPHSTVVVLANTLFVFEDPSTHDTYSAEEFRDLQAM